MLQRGLNESLSDVHPAEGALNTEFDQLPLMCGMLHHTTGTNNFVAAPSEEDRASRGDHMPYWVFKQLLIEWLDRQMILREPLAGNVHPIRSQLRSIGDNLDVPSSRVVIHH